MSADMHPVGLTTVIIVRANGDREEVQAYMEKADPNEFGQEYAEVHFVTPVTLDPGDSMTLPDEIVGLG